MNALDSTRTLVAVMDTIEAIKTNHPVHHPQDMAVRLRQVYAAQDLPLEEDTLEKALAAHVVQAHRSAVPSQKRPRTAEKSSAPARPYWPTPPQFRSHLLKKPRLSFGALGSR